MLFYRFLSLSKILRLFIDYGKIDSHMHTCIGDLHGDEADSNKLKTICASNASVHNNYNIMAINTTTKSGTSKLYQEDVLNIFHTLTHLTGKIIVATLQGCYMKKLIHIKIEHNVCSRVTNSNC